MTMPVEVLEHGDRVEGTPIVRAEFDVSIPAESVFFVGHFDDYPIFPAIAQVDAVVLPRVERTWPSLGAPTELSRIKFLRSIRPGAVFSVVLVRMAELVKFEFRDAAGVIASGQLAYAAKVVE